MIHNHLKMTQTHRNMNMKKLIIQLMMKIKSVKIKTIKQQNLLKKRIKINIKRTRK
jgi:hypothetical protein